jgi:hypothetical protein
MLPFEFDEPALPMLQPGPIDHPGPIVIAMIFPYLYKKIGSEDPILFTYLLD